MIGIDLGGKIMLITGGLGAIAEHIVRKIVAADATVILVDIKSSEQYCSRSRCREHQNATTGFEPLKPWHTPYR